MTQPSDLNESDSAHFPGGGYREGSLQSTAPFGYPRSFACLLPPPGTTNTHWHNNFNEGGNVLKGVHKRNESGTKPMTPQQSMSVFTITSICVYLCWITQPLTGGMGRTRERCVFMLYQMLYLTNDLVQKPRITVTPTPNDFFHKPRYLYGCTLFMNVLIDFSCGVYVPRPV